MIYWGAAIFLRTETSSNSGSSLVIPIREAAKKGSFLIAVPIRGVKGRPLGKKELFELLKKKKKSDGH